MFIDMFTYDDFVCCDYQDVVLGLVVRHLTQHVHHWIGYDISKSMLGEDLSMFLSLGLFSTNWKGKWEFRGGELSRYLALVPASFFRTGKSPCL
jgi:hypothetical protein